MTSESVTINSRRASGSTRPRDYVAVVSGSDWVKEHFPAAGANLWDALHNGEDRRRDPSSAWKPNHDPEPKVTAMTLTINDTTMTSDQTAHTARHAPDRDGWEVSWLPGQLLDRNTAITAMVLADTAAERDVHEGHRLWLHIQSWAAELGLTGHDAVARASQPPGDVRSQQKQDSERPDPAAAEWPATTIRIQRG